MSEIKHIEKWLCNHCDEFHDSFDGAVECCESVSIVEGYQCPKCEKLHDEKISAVNCCAPPELSAEETYAATMAKLEQQGQQTAFCLKPNPTWENTPTGVFFCFF